MTAAGIDYAGRTDVGRTRRRNEDSYFAGGLTGIEGWMLFAVADGLGGHARGDWASRRALELLVSGLGPLVKELGPEDGLMEACQRVNWAVYSEARAMSASGAATTLAVALVRGNEAWWLNIGDSRVYLRTGDRLTQISRDHSWVAEQVDLGLLDPAEVRMHPNRNVVTRTVGFEASVKADVGGPLKLADGDALLLCSDGLFGPVEDFHIAALMAGRPAEDACKRLIEAANQAGGPDNITAVVAHLR